MQSTQELYNETKTDKDRRRIHSRIGAMDEILTLIPKPPKAMNLIY